MAISSAFIVPHYKRTYKTYNSRNDPYYCYPFAPYKKAKYDNTYHNPHSYFSYTGNVWKFIHGKIVIIPGRMSAKRDNR